jgi:hypothetical protein
MHDWQHGFGLLGCQLGRPKQRPSMNGYGYTAGHGSAGWTDEGILGTTGYGYGLAARHLVVAVLRPPLLVGSLRWPASAGSCGPLAGLGG